MRHLVLCSLLCLSGCMQPEVDSSETSDPAPGPPPLTVTTVEGEQFHGQAFELQMIEGVGAVGKAVASNADQQSSWQLIVGLDPSSSATMREGTFPISFQPISAEQPNPLGALPGTGTVSWNNLDQFVAATEGTASYSLHADGTMDGAVTVTATYSLPADGTAVTDAVLRDISATFSSELSIVSCWVYPESLGQEPNGEGVNVSGGQIQDPDFISAFCQPFADLR